MICFIFCYVSLCIMWVHIEFFSPLNLYIGIWELKELFCSCFTFFSSTIQSKGVVPIIRKNTAKNLFEKKKYFFSFKYDCAHKELKFCKIDPYCMNLSLGVSEKVAPFQNCMLLLLLFKYTTHTHIQIKMFTIN